MCGRTAAFPQCGRICGAECGAGRGKCGAGKTETAKNENGSGRFWLVLLHRDRVLCALHCTAPQCTFSVCVSTQPAKNKRVSLLCGCLPVCRHSLFDDYEIVNQCASAGVSSRSVEAELQAYLDLPPTACNPLTFWHDHRTQFERLYRVSRQILCAPASQGAVERLFSIAGYILSQRRLRTNDRNFENILFANVNFDIFDIELRKRKQCDGDDNVK